MTKYIILTDDDRHTNIAVLELNSPKLKNKMVVKAIIASKALGLLEKYFEDKGETLRDHKPLQITIDGVLRGEIVVNFKEFAGYDWSDTISFEEIQIV